MGLTRVVVTQSARSETPGQSSSTGTGCDIRSFLAEFEVLTSRTRWSPCSAPPSTRSRPTFLVSRDVTAVHGGSSCAPDRMACQLLVMKQGGKVKLTDSASGKTYVLKILDIRLVRVRVSGKGARGSGKSHSHSGGLVPGGSDDFGSSVPR